MKKLTLFLLTALLLASVFAGCSASAYMDDPYAGGYSNVSTTRNGTVNGTNGRYAGYGYGANGTYSSYANGTYGNGAYGGGNGVRPAFFAESGIILESDGGEAVEGHE